MKVYWFKLAVMVSLLSSLFFACGDNSSEADDLDPTQRYSKVASYDDLPLCTKKNDGDSVYLESERMYLYCEDGFWSEFIVSTDPSGSASSRGKLNIYAEADDTIPSLDFLYSCSYSYEGDVVFIASINSYMRCYDYKWSEYKPPRPTSSSAATGVLDTIATASRISSFKCDYSHEGDSVFVTDERIYLVCDDGDWTEYAVWSSSSYRSSSSSARSYYTGNVLRDTVLGVCDASREGTLAVDVDDVINASSTDTYECRSGIWLSTTELYLDTRGFPTDTVEGAIKKGLWTEVSATTDAQCAAPFDRGNRVAYVFANGQWRKASDLEICFNKGCVGKNNGAVSKKGTTSYQCNGSTWAEQLFYDMDVSTNFFNSDVTYGTITDKRDSRVYKTVKLGSQTWLAENLKYADSVQTSVLQFHNKCYNNKPENCEKGGRFYSWAAAMGLISDFDTYAAEDFDTTGICPEGWHVPDTTEWGTLLNNYTAAALMAVGAWHYYSSVTPTNASGFTAIPAGETPTVDGGYETTFCTSNQYGSNKSYVYTLAYNSSKLTRTNLTKSSYCSLRCIMNTGTAPVLSSAVVPESSSSVVPESSSSVVPESSSSIIPSSSSVVPESSSSVTTETSSASEPETSSSEDD